MKPQPDEPIEKPVVNVVGAGVALGPLSRMHLPLYSAWMNSVETQAWAAYPVRPAAPMSDERAAQWYERSAADQDRMFYTVYETGSWRAVGFCVLRDIDYYHGTAEFGLTIGNPADRGKGFGTEAVQLLLDVAFTALGLQNVQLVVYEFNHAGRRAYEKAGFREIGRRRQAYFMGGRHWDVIYMDCLASEFSSPVLGEILDPDTAR
jgi:diamine N-acetyltransferase